ncbi:MAG: septum formation family protein [Pseudonocardiaceae bacterium]
MATPQRPVSARLPLGAAAPLLAAVTLVAGCAQMVEGTPVPAPTTSPPTAGSSSPLFPSGRPIDLGDCVLVAGFRVVDCAQPHELEVFHIAELPEDLAAGYPTPATVLPRFEPRCRAELPRYVGNSDVDASRVREFVYWPSRQGWIAGERWVLCTAVEIGPDDRPLQRTGAIEGALRAGLGELQACAQDPPSAGTLRVVPCSEPHLGEAVPGVLNLGAPADPPVTAEQANAAAEPHCRRAIDSFLRAPGGQLGLRYSWRYPLPQSWPNGYTTVVCYAETDAPVTGSLRDP